MVDAVTNSKNVSNGILNDVIEFSQDVHQRALAKMEEYKAAEQKRSIFALVKNKAFSKFEAAKIRSKNDKNNFDFKSAKAEYDSASKTYRDYEIDAEVLLSSCRSANSYDAKMSVPANIASGMLA